VNISADAVQVCCLNSPQVLKEIGILKISMVAEMTKEKYVQPLKIWFTPWKHTVIAIVHRRGLNFAVDFFLATRMKEFVGQVAETCKVLRFTQYKIP
jgi:hypothetical protein